MANLLREYFELCPGGVCEDLLTEADKRFIKNGGMIMTGVIQRADARNGNGRIYAEPILQREMKRYGNLVKERMALGELDHPETSTVMLEKVSHLVTEVWWNGKDVMGKIEVLNTPRGKILQELVNANVKIGISSRGTGSVRESREGTIVEDDFSLICFDIVSEPSTHGAYMYRQDGIRENKNQNKIDTIIQEILQRKGK
ncbi:MAG: hypothetical protein RIR47_1039 [Bacteroidota bacterium]|jgi:hypothetical protein